MSERRGDAPWDAASPRRQTTAEQRAARAEKVQQGSDKAERKTRGIANRVRIMDTLLKRGLKEDSFLDFGLIETKTKLPVFQPGDLSIAPNPPVRSDYRSRPPRGLSAVLPGSWVRYGTEVMKSRQAYREALIHHQQQEENRCDRLDEARAAHERLVAEAKVRIEKERAEFKYNFEAGNKYEVREYFRQVLARRQYPVGFPNNPIVGSEESKLLVEFELPTFEVVPKVVEYKYVKANDEIRPVLRSQDKRKALYNSIVSQITLLLLRDIFKADLTEKVESVKCQGMVDTKDPATGNPVRPCLMTVEVARDEFLRLTLDDPVVDPVRCLKHLHHQLSPRPDELADVQPLFFYSLSDPRFVEGDEGEVLSSLDDRANLAHINYELFERLIVDLFKAMRYDVRRTRTAKDGGIDCVAVHPDPIHGGSVSIQAKRWTKTVQVKDVRELWGTMQAENAAVGILVTTSDFASGCGNWVKKYASSERDQTSRIRLWNGSNLLWLLKEHTQYRYKIQLPGKPPKSPIRPYEWE